MDQVISITITLISSILASTGLWAYVTRQLDKKSAKTQLLVGLAHDRIMDVGMRYIDRRWITQDEYENLYEYLYKPYKAMGGNGSAERIMKEIDHLPIKPNGYSGEEDK